MKTEKNNVVLEDTIPDKTNGSFAIAPALLVLPAGMYPLKFCDWQIPGCPVFVMQDVFLVVLSLLFRKVASVIINNAESYFNRTILNGKSWIAQRKLTQCLRGYFQTGVTQAGRGPIFFKSTGNPFHSFQCPDTIAGMAGGTALVILPNINRYGHRTNSFAGSDRSGGRLWRFAFATMAAEFFPPQAARVSRRPG